MQDQECPGSPWALVDFQIHKVEPGNNQFYFEGLAYCLNVCSTPLQQCLPFSWTTLRGKHRWHPTTVMGVVDTFGH